ncbi:MarR family transcriptional regulator [Mesorhizobium silamurunense]|uniref:MarR family transcriptional regulator n=1 Tax=Mesorhizobium silamurunense TaxID=499528 RepID=UPI00177C8329|nr:MarR family transcriptional regulator [Mesorhizobium silamurunense]
MQRIVNDLHDEGIVAFEPNPHHRRAQLVVLTARARAAYDAALRLWSPLVEELAAGLSASEVAVVRTGIMAFRQKLEKLIGDEPNELR